MMNWLTDVDAILRLMLMFYIFVVSHVNVIHLYMMKCNTSLYDVTYIVTYILACVRVIHRSNCHIIKTFMCSMIVNVLGECVCFVFAIVLYVKPVR